MMTKCICKYSVDAIPKAKELIKRSNEGTVIQDPKIMAETICQGRI